MVKQFSVRYGRNYKVVLALVLPMLLIVPFILWLSQYPSLEEWKVWLLIFTFLGLIISLSIWLALRVYPPTVMSLRDSEISLSFDQNNYFSPSDFKFHLSDIVSFTQGQIRGDEYYIFITRNPKRNFQLSSSSYSVEDMLSFNEAMVIISEQLAARQ